MALVETASACLAGAHHLDATGFLMQVLTHRDVDLLGSGRILVVRVDLRIRCLPVPRIVRVDQFEGPVGLAQREEISDPFRSLGRVAEQQGLALPMEPELRIESRPVKQFVDLLSGLSGPAIHHEGDLRHVLSEPTLPLEYLTEPHDHIFIDQRIGRVENHKIHACVREQSRVASQNPWIVAAIIAEQRFAPEMKCVDWAPRRRCIGLRGVRMVSENLGVVIDPIQTQPEKVEHAHVAVVAECPHLRWFGHWSLKVIRTVQRRWRTTLRECRAHQQQR